MRIQRLKKLVAVLGLSALVALLGMSWAASKTEAARPRPQDKPATAPAVLLMEQKYKNIQALRGLPAAQLRPMMNYISAALGMQCTECHVRDGAEMAFEKDDNEHKLAARRMITMTRELNQKYFDGNTEVGCYTCHAGHERPAGIPPFPSVRPPNATPGGPPPGAAGAVGPTGGPGVGGPPARRPSAEPILAQYLAAIGGKEAVGKITTRTLKGVSVAPNGQSFPLEIFYAGPDKLALSVTFPQGGTAQKLNGTMGWLKNQREDRALDSVELIRAQDLAWSLELLPLKEPYPRMGFGGVQKVGERECNVVRAALPDKRRVQFFFDKETGLLLRRIVTTATVIGLDPVQTDYEDYRTVDGVQVPFTIITKYLDNFASSVRKFTEIKHNEKIDPSLFLLSVPPAMPKPAPPRRKG